MKILRIPTATEYEWDPTFIPFYSTDDAKLVYMPGNGRASWSVYSEVDQIPGMTPERIQECYAQTYEFIVVEDDV